MSQLTLLGICLLICLATASFNPVCLLCHDVVKLIQKSVKKQPIQFLIEDIAIEVCSKKHVEPKNVCKGAIKEMTGIILNQFWLHQTDPHMVCPNLKLCRKEYQKRILQNDIDQIMKGKVSKQWETPTLRKTLKIMHISDVHVDLFYTTGAESKCNEPTCCKSNSTANLTIDQILLKHTQGNHL